MLDVIYVIVGIGFAVTSILIGRKFKLESWLYTPTIMILPLIYIGFAFVGNSPNAALLELQYGLPFIALSVLTLLIRKTPIIYLAAVAWLLHGVYDMMHDVFFINPGVWFWYPALCAGYDIGIGVYLLYAGRQIASGIESLRANPG